MDDVAIMPPAVDRGGAYVVKEGFRPFVIDVRPSERRDP
jgi:hypothetical protein